MSDPIPEWAIERARAAYRQQFSNDLVCLNYDSHFEWQHAFARYIAEHEEPPVDPLREAIDAIQDVDGFWLPASTAPQFDATKNRFVAALRAELAKRGMELAREQDQ